MSNGDLTERCGCLVAFEGTEGAGKSTHIQLAADALRRDGYRVEVTAEPGGTTLGREIRELLLHREESVPMPMAELFLCLADRAQHVAEVIRPALQEGHVVLTDRFSGSTIAYQGYGRELDLAEVVRADAWVRNDLAPDVTVLLDCPVREGLRRAHESDRFHAEVEAFHERIRRGFLALAAEDPERWCVLDSTQPKDVVQARVMEAIRGCLPARR